MPGICCRRWASYLALAAILVDAERSPAFAQQPTQVTVFAAASLKDAFAAAAEVLGQRRPALAVHFNFAGSQQLAFQLEQGARADVFASADQRWMQAVRDSGLIAGTPSVFARNRLVVITPAANPGRVDRLQDLRRHGLKLVLAAEAVPAGKYSREALGRLAGAPGFGADYPPQVLRNVVSQEENVKAVVTKVQLGEADAGMVYVSDVTPTVRRAVRVIEIPDQYNVVATYPIAVLRSAAEPAAAQAFLRFVLSPDGQALLARHGLLPAEAQAVVPSGPNR
jgi:molybdate transport system substrate-binding protein